MLEHRGIASSTAPRRTCGSSLQNFNPRSMYSKCVGTLPLLVCVYAMALPTSVLRHSLALCQTMIVFHSFCCRCSSFYVPTCLASSDGVLPPPVVALGCTVGSMFLLLLFRCTTPKSDKITGIRTKPCPTPYTIIPKNILKKVRKIAEFEAARGIIPKKVVSPPRNTGGPISSSIPLTASSRVVAWCCSPKL